MLNDPKIVWEKWYDPFGEDDKENLSRPSLDNENNEFYHDEDDPNSEKQHEGVELFKNPTKVIITPIGIIPYTENTASNKIFNFWTGHSNFSISEKIVDIINNFNGIETLDIFTRYRFRIAIGKVFNEREIMLSLTDTIYNYIKK